MKYCLFYTIMLQDHHSVAIHIPGLVTLYCTYPELLQLGEVGNILNPLDEVVGDVECDQVHQSVQSFHLLDAIVTDVELLQIYQCL